MSPTRSNLNLLNQMLDDARKLQGRSTDLVRTIEDERDAILAQLDERGDAARPDRQIDRIADDVAHPEFVDMGAIFGAADAEARFTH